MTVRKNRYGFTLAELMIALAIVAILAAFALPAYQQYTMRGKRAAAQAQMMEIANLEQQSFVANRSYMDRAALVSNGYTLPGNLTPVYSYDVTVGSGAVPSFTITFTAIGNQTSDGNLTLDSAGNKTPSGKW